LENYENITYSSFIKNRSLKDIPQIKPGTELKGGLSFDEIQNQFQKMPGTLPQYSMYKTFSGILSKKYSLDSSLIDESSSKGAEDQNNKKNLFRNQLSLELIRLHHADALTIAGNIFLSPQKKDISSDRGKALLVHEITHLVQNERNSQNSRDADTITSSEYLEMEKEAQDAEADFLRLSVHRKLNEQKKFSPAEHYYRNNINLESFALGNERDIINDKVIEHPLVHPNITKIFKRIMKEDISSLVNEGSQTAFSNTGKGNSLSNSIDQSSTAKKFKTEQVFLASEGRSVYPPAATPLSNVSSVITSLASGPSKDILDLNILAEQVYQLMSRRLVMERSRRGIR